MSIKQYTLTVQEIRSQTKDSITLSFKQPGLRKIKYLAGQYLTLILRINGRKYVRPYSFSSSPSVDSFLEITVKKIPNGIVSNYINNELKVGDVVEVMEPMGDFIYDFSNSGRSLYFWGVGSGITPLFSIIKEVLNKEPKTIIHLIYGNKNTESTIFRKELDFMKTAHSSSFKMINFYSQVDDIEQNDTIKKGRISLEFVAQLVSQDENIKNSLHYICGPDVLKKEIINSLLEFKVSAESIFAEMFELVKDTRELQDVEDSNVNIFFQGKNFEIFVPKGKNILEVALDQDIDIPYSCQIGNCSNCKATIKEGNLKMVGLTKKRVDLENNEFLLCCSYPLTRSICIEIN
jgi:ring-1,2-phenylacetyl-CoA epoxidase subunit PaaE